LIEINQERLDSLFDAFKTSRIAVLGDLMVDHYVWGSVSRISPEAPVPVVSVEEETHRLGGAANVALNIKELGAQVVPIGIVGVDHAGQQLKELFAEKGLDTDGLIVDPNRPTTFKTRVIAHHQHVVRTDFENSQDIDKSIESKVMEALERIHSTANGLILQDYNKGLLTQTIIQKAIASFQDKITFVDPKYNHFFDYRNATLFKPNRKETADRLGLNLDDDANIQKAGKELLERLSCEAVLITLGEAGMVLFEKDKPEIRVPTKAVKVHDVSGAGDTVISTLAVAMSAGASIPEAATLANHAAGIVVGEVGIIPITRQDLYRAMMDDLKSDRV